VTLNPELEPFDPECGRFASEMDYLDDYLEEGESRTEYVLREEGTLNPINHHFLCDMCYIKAGTPSGSGGSRWVCP
jgi:hypothetical protein